jgi:hypothetical protein
MITGLPTDMRSVQEAGHRVVPRLWTRKPVGGSWIELSVLDATVTYAAAAEYPGRTLDATVMLEAKGYPSIIDPFDDNLVDWIHPPLSPFGSWLKAEQIVYRMDQTQIVIPWGIYRVDTIVIDQLASTVKITATDATSQISERQFVTLAQGRIGATQSMQAKMTQIVTDVFTGNIPSWWSGPVIDFSGLTDKPYGGKGGTYTEDRMDALGRLVSKMAPSWRFIAPRQGSILKAVQPGNPDAEPAYVTVARNLIFPEFADTVDRDGLFNEVMVTYEVTNPDTYGQIRTQQRRIVCQYVDAGEELAGTGPFGWSTREAVSIDIPTGTADPNQYVRDLADDLIGRSFYSSRAITVQTGPIYGLEQGDPVYIQVEATGIRKRARLVGATIPLRADGGPWSLELAMIETLDPSWRPRYSAVIVDQTTYEDNFEWADFKPTTVLDLDAGHGPGKTKKPWRGWTVDNDSKLVGGGTLTATSNGGQVVFRTTDRAWSEVATEHRYLAKASVTAAKGSLQARIGLDTNTQGIFWSAWTKFDSTKTHTLSLDTKRLVSPAAVTFGIRIETSGMSAGEQVRMNSASVEKAVRNKT